MTQKLASAPLLEQLGKTLEADAAEREKMAAKIKASWQLLFHSGSPHPRVMLLRSPIGCGAIQD